MPRDYIYHPVEPYPTPTFDDSDKKYKAQTQIAKDVKNINKLLGQLTKDITDKKKHTVIQQVDLIHKFYQHLLWFREHGLT